MAETLTLTATDKAGRYEEILPQIASVTADETDRTANLANTAAILKEAFDFFWVGFYEVKSTDGGEAQLVLGPFQGPLACTRIRRGRGVCGTAWAERRTLVVPDVDLFPGHIACSSLSRSEIVVPRQRRSGRRHRHRQPRTRHVRRHRPPPPRTPGRPPQRALVALPARTRPHFHKNLTQNVGTHGSCVRSTQAETAHITPMQIRRTNDPHVPTP